MSSALLPELLLHPGEILPALTHTAIKVASSYGMLVAGVVLLTAAGYLAMWSWRHSRMAREARQVTVLAPPEATPESAQAFWANLVGLLSPAYKRIIFGQPHLGFEYVWADRILHIRIWVPGSIPPGMVERAAEAAWPAARAETGPAVRPLPDQTADTATVVTVTVGGHLRLARPDWYPLRTDHPTDPLRPLLGAVYGFSADQHATVQILARPVTGRRLARAHRAAASLRGGHPTPVRGQLFDLISPASARRRTPSAYVAHPEYAGEVRAILDKATEPQYDVVIRYALTSTIPAKGTDTQRSYRSRRRKARRALRGHAHALAAATAVFSGRNHLRRRPCRPARAISYLLHRRWLRHGDLLSVTELAALAHLPYDAAVPGLVRAGAKSVQPSPIIASPGPGTKTLGVTDAGPRRPVALGVAESRQHVHIQGATGSGKSTLAGNMFLDDANDTERGAAVFDPRGDLVTDLLSRLPEHAIDRVVLFDPRQRVNPTLNILQGADRDLTADNIRGIFARIFKENWGPRTDDICRAAILTLWGRPGASLADIPRLLTDSTYRVTAVAQVRDDILRGFWDWYESLSIASRANAIGPLLNKLRAFLLRDFIRSTIASPTSSIDLASVLDGGLLLLRIPKGELGADAASLFGSLVLAKIWETVTARARQGEYQRHDTALYVDEADNFLTLPHGLGDMLAEARGYRLSLVLAHQHQSQLSRDLRDAVSANARNKIYFATSPEDAHALADHTFPNLTEHDLAHLGGFQAATRLVVGNATTPAFTLRTRRLPPPIKGRARAVRRAARANATRHGRPSHRGARSAPVDDPRARGDRR